MRPLRPDAAKLWPVLHQIETRGRADLEERLVTALEQLRAGVVLEQLERAIEAQDIDEVLRVIALPEFEQALAAVETHAESIAAAAHDVAAPSLAEELAADALALEASGAVPSVAAASARLHLSFAQLSDAVLAEIRVRAANRVVGVVDETRLAIRGAVERAYAAGKPPRAAAKEIKAIVGLTDRQAASVDAMRAEGATDAELARATKKMIAQRANTIARTEANIAMNAGQRATWRDLVDQRLLAPELWVREWLTVTPASRVCELCQPLDGATAPIDGAYPEPGADGPPLHPNCRCSEVLRPITTSAT